MFKKIASREVRKYLYGLAIAFVPVAVYYGWVEVEASILVLPLMVALFNLSPKDVDEVMQGQVAPASGSVPIEVAQPVPEVNTSVELDIDLDDGLDASEGINAPIVDSDGNPIEAETEGADVVVETRVGRHAE